MKKQNHLDVWIELGLFSLSFILTFFLNLRDFAILMFYIPIINIITAVVLLIKNKKLSAVRWTFAGLSLLFYAGIIWMIAQLAEAFS